MLKLLRKKGGGLSPFKAGLLFLVLLVPALYFGFTKSNPFANPYTFTAYFESANDLNVGFSPVRIAGVDVGQVTKVEPLENGTARVTMTVEPNGLPMHEDAELKIRPRIFLEGNFFVDVHPGTPSAPILDDDGTIAINQTAYPVQFGQVLSSLKQGTRENLRTLLTEYSVKGLGGDGAKSFNNSIPYWEPAYRNTSLANEGTLGLQPHDLSNLLRGQQRTFEAVNRDERSLKDVITNFEITANAFAREDEALEADIVALRDFLKVADPALRSLNAALPSVRAFARDALPGTRSTPAMIDATTPLLVQIRELVSEPELKGLVRELRPTVEDLAELNRDTIPLLEEGALLSSCQNEVILPWLNTKFQDPDDPRNEGRVYEILNRALVGLAGEGRTGDANGHRFRILGLIRQSIFETLRNGVPNDIVSGGEGVSLPPAVAGLLGDLRPNLRPIRTPRPDFRPNVPCETQEPPNLDAPGEVGNDLPDTTAILGALVFGLFTGDPANLGQQLLLLLNGLMDDFSPASTAGAADIEARDEGSSDESRERDEPADTEDQPEATPPEPPAGEEPGSEGEPDNGSDAGAQGAGARRPTGRTGQR